MRKILILTIVSLFLAFSAWAEPAEPAKPVEWKLDAAHSGVSFSVRHLGISNVKGKFGEFAAKIQAEKETGKITDLEATIKTASINTGIDARDKHLRSDDFFNAEKFPEMKFKAKSIKFNGNIVTVEGDLTIRDATKPITFTGEYVGVQKANFGQGEQLRAGYTLVGKLNRFDYNLKWNNLMEGVALVGDTVTISIEAEISNK